MSLREMFESWQWFRGQPRKARLVVLACVAGALVAAVSLAIATGYGSAIGERLAQRPEHAAETSEPTTPAPAFAPPVSELQRAPAALSRAPEPSSAAPLTVQLAPTHAVEPSRTGPAKTGARQAAVGSGTRVEQHIQTGDVTASGRSQINIGVVNTSE